MKNKILFILVLQAVIVFMGVLLCYRQTQIQESLIDTNKAMGSVLLEARQREREYYDIMHALDIQKKTGEIIISTEAEND